MEEDKVFSLTVLGTRGSMPGEGKDFALYGGSTSCYRIRVDDEEIYLDAGSGIAGAKIEKNTNITILLTHMHLDHIIGLPFFPALTDKGRQIKIYAAEREGLQPKDAIDCLVTVPFWPAKIENYPADTTFHTLPKTAGEKKFFYLGNVEVSFIEGTHPSGSTIFKLTHEKKSVVYATDFEHLPSEGCDRLIDFARGCDLFLYDAQYTEGEYKKFRGYGHSTPEVGIKIAELAEVKKILFVHHAPWRKDFEIAEMENFFRAANENIFFARIGQKFFL